MLKLKKTNHAIWGWYAFRAEDEILLKTLKTEAMESGESFSLNDKTVTQLASQLQNRETNEVGNNYKR